MIQLLVFGFLVITAIGWVVMLPIGGLHADTSTHFMFGLFWCGLTALVYFVIIVPLSYYQAGFGAINNSDLVSEILFGTSGLFSLLVIYSLHDQLEKGINPMDSFREPEPSLPVKPSRRKRVRRDPPGLARYKRQQKAIKMQHLV